ncbi:hypothetical protein CK203_107404 [Vitis vinifera]|uniref:Uncharacterized protein n=1 Tax=Vitis vinifera TaxID=29760 RepID=A0A438CTJ1_VITVI|nr:hypothetical protein CK203_107404 [Vitis vinifera]
MASLLHFEEKVHKRRLTRANTILLLFPRLLCHVLAHMGFPADLILRPAAIPLPSIFAPSTSAHSEPVPEVASSDAPPAIPPTPSHPLLSLVQTSGLLPPAPPVSPVPSEPFASADDLDPADNATSVAVPSTVAVEDPSYPPEEPTT